MWAWNCTPPIRAAQVWDIPPANLRCDLKPHQWVFPAYQRLAMGGSHPVHILMDINTTAIGRALTASRALGASQTGVEPEAFLWTDLLGLRRFR